MKPLTKDQQKAKANILRWMDKVNSLVEAGYSVFIGGTDSTDRLDAPLTFNDEGDQIVEVFNPETGSRITHAELDPDYEDLDIPIEEWSAEHRIFAFAPVAEEITW